MCAAKTRTWADMLDALEKLEREAAEREGIDYSANYAPVESETANQEVDFSEVNRFTLNEKIFSHLSTPEDYVEFCVFIHAIQRGEESNYKDLCFERVKEFHMIFRSQFVADYAKTKAQQDGQDQEAVGYFTSDIDEKLGNLRRIIEDEVKAPGMSADEDVNVEEVVSTTLEATRRRKVDDLSPLEIACNQYRVLTAGKAILFRKTSADASPEEQDFQVKQNLIDFGTHMQSREAHALLRAPNNSGCEVLLNAVIRFFTGKKYGVSDLIKSGLFKPRVATANLVLDPAAHNPAVAAAA